MLKEELAKPEVIGWLRNLDRKPWSLEIPYETGGDIRPMFPDLVIVRKVGADTTVDILEPHDPSLGDNFEKAVGLARFAEHYGALFGRIQMIRKQSSPAGGEHYARLEINKESIIKQLLPVTSNPQLDALFSSIGNLNDEAMTNSDPNTYWFVGASYGGTDDQTPRFLAEGIWENGYEDKYLDTVRAMQPGERIAIKAVYTQKHELPFDNRDQTGIGDGDQSDRHHHREPRRWTARQGGLDAAGSSRVQCHLAQHG